jgi:hypothetical protein
MCWRGRTGRRRSADAMPAPRWDLISTSLFLHHFDGSRSIGCSPQRLALRPLLRLRARSARWLAAGGQPPGRRLGANAVTREDAVLSVHAGFPRRRDVRAAGRWPAVRWQVREFAAGLFSHCFSAQRCGAGPMSIRTAAPMFDARRRRGPAGSTAIQLARAGWSVASSSGSLPAPQGVRRVHRRQQPAAAAGAGHRRGLRCPRGPGLAQVTLLQGDAPSRPTCRPPTTIAYAWGRALGRETLDSLLLEQAVAAGADGVSALGRASHPGAGRGTGAASSARSSQGALPSGCARSRLVDAHGSWGPARGARAHRQHAATPTCWPSRPTSAARAARGVDQRAGPGRGLRRHGGGRRRHDHRRLLHPARSPERTARAQRPGGRGRCVEAWLQRECRRATGAAGRGARRTMAVAGPLDPGVRLEPRTGSSASATRQARRIPSWVRA